jgi:serine/threonine-protein kinase
LTEKDLAERHPDATSVEADLEDALALEASRTGTSTGEASAVLRTLPATTRRRLPLRLRLHAPLLLVIVMLAVAGGILYMLLREGVERTQRGTGPGRVEAPRGEEIISVARTSAHDFDPLGDRKEHTEQAPLAVDNDNDTVWTTENYRANVLTKPLGVPGVGLYIDAKPSVNARSLQIQTPKPGWQQDIYAARARPTDDWPSNAWTRVGGGTVSKRTQTFKLRTGDKRYRYYLVWIKKLPPDDGRAEITQVTLSAPKR